MSMFFTIYLPQQKKCQDNWILRTHKKILFFKKKLVLKKNVLLNKKIIFVFRMIFKFDCIMQIISFIIHKCLYSLFILLLFSYISLQEMGHRKNTDPSLLIQVAKSQQNERKKKLRGIRVWVLNMELVKLIVLFCSFLFRQFYHLIFAPVQKS